MQLISKVKIASTCLYESIWLEHINDSTNNPKLRTYKLFKYRFSLENYMLCIKNVVKRKEFSKLRISSHSLRIESARYVKPIIPAEQRYCLLCNSGDIEDEKHFLLYCSTFKQLRATGLVDLASVLDLDSLHDPQLFACLMSYNDGDTEVAGAVCTLVCNLADHRKSLL
jgi:hypothetical protein